MQPINKLLSISFLSSIMTTVLAQRKQVAGQYITKGYNFGVLLILKSDKYFTCRFQGHISSDTDAGQYDPKGMIAFAKVPNRKNKSMR
jgi:hypothetical protein